jgi:hypothetical protein
MGCLIVGNYTTPTRVIDSEFRIFKPLGVK